MYKVIIDKPGKRLNFQGKLYTTPCKFYVDDKNLDLAKLILRKAGINERFSFQKVVECKAREDANKAVNDVVMEALKKASEEVVAQVEQPEEPKEEQHQEEIPQMSKASKKSKRR